MDDASIHYFSKRCTRCGEEKELTAFGKASNMRDGRASACLKCSRLRDKLRYLKNPEQRKETSKWSALKWKHGVSRKEWESLWEKQEGKCAICGVGLLARGYRKSECACLDHCHETDKIRGLLCSTCNQGIGLLKDDSNVVLKAYEYLRGHGK